MLFLRREEYTGMTTTNPIPMLGCVFLIYSEGGKPELNLKKNNYLGLAVQSSGRTFV